MITPLSKECLFIFSISLSVYSIVISLSSTKVHIIFHICKSVTIILSSLNGTYVTGEGYGRKYRKNTHTQQIRVPQPNTNPIALIYPPSYGLKGSSCSLHILFILYVEYIPHRIISIDSVIIVLFFFKLSYGFVQISFKLFFGSIIKPIVNQCSYEVLQFMFVCIEDFLNVFWI